jgi:uncharacterized protein (TIGR02679 family)
MDVDAAVDLVDRVRAVLDRLEDLAAATSAPVPISRVDLAASVLGSSHALDAGTRVEVATTRALGLRLGPAEPRDLWERAGADLDLTSGPALAWNLPIDPPSGLASLADAATSLGVPLHLSRFALRAHPASVPPGTDVLVVENPRLVEAAAQARLTQPVVSANGNPSGAVRLLLSQLAAAGAELRYHGDFDAAGLAMCARMVASGLRPWRMEAADYLDAVAGARSDDVALPLDDSDAGPTPWDPALQAAFNAERRIVHEERLLPGLLDQWLSHAPGAG